MKDEFQFSQVIFCFVGTPDCLFFSRMDFSHPLFTQEIFTKFPVSGPGWVLGQKEWTCTAQSVLSESSLYFRSKDRQRGCRRVGNEI